uniref:PH and SEC7 domain-containing protein 1 n=1 Tax=Phallusia mammillata TaxID=59560 RepID=A0A6F9DQA1_9ASCI|nr:PH and SEC7 domain-containing protein 1 [Phallusia mammillata]
MLQLHTVMDNVPRKKMDRSRNGSIINQFIQHNNNSPKCEQNEGAVESLFLTQYCYDNKDKEAEIAEHNGNHTAVDELNSSVFSSVTADSQLFVVNRFDNDSSAGIEIGKSDVTLPVPDSRSSETSDRRDSGFHTMSRPNHDVEKKSSSLSDATDTEVSDRNKLQLNLPTRTRSSPLLTRKSDHRPIRQSAAQFANKLFLLDGFERADVAKHLSKTDEYSRNVATSYMAFFNFSKQTLDEAMRSFFTHFVLVGESQERERILDCLATRYVACNPEFLNGSQDTTHKLICAIALLNTDLHLGTAMANRRRMTCKEFVNNLEGLGPDDNNFPTQLLKDIYKAIKKKPLPWSGSGAAQKNGQHQSSNRVTKSPSMKPKTTKAAIVARSQSNRLNRAAIEPILPMRPSREDMGAVAMGGRSSKTKTLPKKQGVLFRKLIVDSDGNRTSKRKRKWKLLVVAIHGLELHLAKKGATQASKVSIHHSLAEVELPTSGATKRDHVFRVSFANRSALLFQASSEDELEKWIGVINRNAALLSAAPLPAAVGSQLIFQRPLQPSAPSTLPLAKQLQQQQGRLATLRRELDEIPSKLGEKDQTPPQKQYLEDKQAFLRTEIHKYEVYTSLLEKTLHSARKIRNDFLRATEAIAEDDEKAGDPIPESGSLISVSPSEPGAASTSTSLAMTSGEQSESTGNLIDYMPRKHSRATPIRTVLSPTSSLPNLHPMDSPCFKFPPMAAVEDEETPASQGESAPTHTFDFVPSVSETTDGRSAVKLVKSVDSLNNSNNSNSTDVDYWSSLGNENFGYSTTGRIKQKPVAEHTGMTPCASADRIDVTRHQSMTSGRREHDFAHSRQPGSFRRANVEIETSLVNGPVVGSAPSKSLHDTLMRRTEMSNDQIHSQHSLARSSAPPRVRGRRERQGSSRYSYLQAVRDPAKHDA